MKYADGTNQVLSYYVTKPAAEVVSDLGRFLFTKQWYENPNDPFKRSPSIMSYDRAKNRIVDQDARVDRGAGRRGGSGSWLAAGMKLFGQPTKEEVAQHERFIDGVLWGGIQCAGARASTACAKACCITTRRISPTFPMTRR